MNFNLNRNSFTNLIKYVANVQPKALAKIKGGDEFANIVGNVKFYSSPQGVLVESEVENLPQTETNIFAEHIHEIGECENSFESAGNHFNPENLPHPQHAGDLPPLFSNNGKAFSIVLTNRFSIEEIIGRSIIIHLHPDDFYSQPSGNSGKRIACGIIEKF